jgi:hypothetical protein
MMAKYVLKYNELVEMESTQLELEFEQLEKWLHKTGIDSDFDRNEHIYVDAETGDRWIFLPELSDNQTLAMELIVSSSQVMYDSRPLRRGPAASEDEVEATEDLHE